MDPGAGIVLMEGGVTSVGVRDEGMHGSLLRGDCGGIGSNDAMGEL